MDFRTILIYTICYFGIFTATMFFISFFENTAKLRNPRPKRHPSISIIIPAYNCERTLAKTVNSLLRLRYPQKLEIIIVDDGSTDGTLAVARSFSDRGVHVFHKQNGGKGSALNYGLGKASGEIVGGMDADCFATPAALQKMVGYFENPAVMAVAPSVKIWGQRTFLQRVQMIEFLSATIIRKIFSYFGGVPLVPGPLSLFRKSFFETYGGYAERNLTEDIELSLRIESKRFLIESALDAVVYTTAHASYRKAYAQRLRWFKGFIDNMWTYRRLFGPAYGNLGMFVLPVSVISILMGIVMFAYGMARLGYRAIQQTINLSLIGFDIRTWLDVDVDLFFISTSARAILLLALLGISVTILWLAKRHSREPQPIARSAAYFMLTYWFLAALCWISAGWYKATGRKIRWGPNAL